VSVVRIRSHLVRGLSIFLYSSEVFFRPVGHYQWCWILKNERREGERERGREGGGKEGERDGEEDDETPLSMTLTMTYKLWEG